MPFKPYLELRGRISQVWLNQHTLIFTLAAVKLVFFSVSLRQAIERSKQSVLSSCDSVDYFYMQFMGAAPAYLCQFGNYLVQQSIKESIKTSLAAISLLVYAGEKLSTFLFDLYFGTYLCLATSAVDGAVSVATNTTEKVLDFVNGTVEGLGEDLNTGLNDISEAINKVLGALNDVESFFKGSDSTDISSEFKTVNLTIEKLKDFQIPSSIDSKLEELSNSTPDFDTVLNKTHSEISKPFELVRTKITAFNVSKMIATNRELYFPANSSNSTSLGPCSSSKPDIVKFYAGLSNAISVALIILALALALAAIAAIMPSLWEENRRWGKLVNLQRDVHEAEIDYVYPKNGHRPDVIESYQKVYERWPTALGIWLAPRLANSEHVRQKVRWCVAYAMSPRALTVLAVSVTGVVMCICQFILIAVLRRAATGSAVQQLTSSTLSNANASLQNDMSAWATSANQYINSTSSSLNSELFGWVNTTTSTVNATVNSAIDDIDTTLADFFNGTLLYKPMTSVVRCTIENKLYKIQSAMTWVNEKLQISLPLVDQAELSTAFNRELSTQDSANSSNTALQVGQKIAQNAQTLILAILHQYRTATLFELGVSLVLFAVWVLQWLIAIARCVLFT
ncbi:LAQU0S15e01618g1_1 [Lachancea quebecensis]|uniref:Plasma membrane fusion protein PRM1 n=1 Tax=Lachancea quebecensis TaxID=1654605 RepID=A0A0P1KWJ6_9SACH|nr:LAQU0S15e01618g1_1 [Lachancea quebecensis]